MKIQSLPIDFVNVNATCAELNGFHVKPIRRDLTHMHVQRQDGGACNSGFHVVNLVQTRDQ